MVFAIVVSVIISVVVWCIYRIHKYPLAKGIRLLAPIFLPLFMLKRPLLHFANAFLTKMTHPRLLPGLSKENGMARSVYAFQTYGDRLPAPSYLSPWRRILL